MLKDRRKDWQKKSAHKWTRCGSMLKETEVEQNRMDRRIARNALPRPPTLTNNTLRWWYRVAPGRKMTAEIRRELIFMQTWCDSWGRSYSDYVNEGFAPWIIDR